MAYALHNHTHYSRLDGKSTPEEIVRRVQETNLNGAAITDHDFCTGHIDFYETLTKGDLKPMLGIETYQAPIHLPRHQHAESQTETDALGNKKKLDNFHLILLARTPEGLRNIWRLNTESHRTGFYFHGRVDWNLLEEFSEGVICTSGCALGHVAQAILQGGDPDSLILRYKKIFKDNFYLELGTYQEEFQRQVNAALVELARNHNLPLVYGNDAHYAFPDQYELHEGLLALQFREKLRDTLGAGAPHHIPCLYIMSEQEVRDSLSYLPQSAVDEAISNTDLIAEGSHVDLPTYRLRTPTFIPEVKYENSWDMIFSLAQAGFQTKVIEQGKDLEVYLERFKQELGVIHEANLYDYFLIVRDYIQFARDNKIMVGPGRGSVGGSLVAYLIDITEIDPIPYGLIFERFYNVGREKSLPDIDTDFSKRGREKVKEYIAQRYGRKYVADLGTYTTMKAKSAFEDMGRVLAVPRQDTEAISKILDATIEAGLQSSWDKIWDKVGEQLLPYQRKYPKMFEWAEQLYRDPDKDEMNFIRGYSIHASGVLIGDEELDNVFPLRWVSKEKKLVTQFNMKIAGDFGFMKADLLGLITLDILEELDQILEERGHPPVPWSQLHEMEHPEEMWDMLSRGLTVGLFQIEDGALAKKIAKDLSPHTLEELGIIVAMNRPGPITAGSFERYMKGRKGEEIIAIHPLVMEAARETYGEFVYQEQVIKFFTLIGYSLQEADDIRSYIGKKKRDKMQEELPRYLERASLHMDEAIARRIWDLIEGFSEYGFNKSHAILYGDILLRTLYAKYYYTREFILAAIRVHIREKHRDKAARMVEEAQRFKIPVEGPDINLSSAQVDLEGDGIRYGFMNIKGFGKGPSNWIVNWRPFESSEHMAETAQKINTKVTLPAGMMRVGINKSQIETLVQLGAFGESPLGFEDLLDLQEELLGVAISDRSAAILAEFNDEIERHCVPFGDIVEDGEYNIAGVIKEIDDTRVTRKGKPYAIVTVQNDIDQLNLYVWSDELKRLRFMWRRRVVGIFNIERNTGERGTFYTVRNAQPLFSKKYEHTSAAK